MTNTVNEKMINEVVNNYFELNIKRNTRKRPYVEARAIYFKLCRDFTRLSLEQIGNKVNRNHASVLHGIKTLNNWVGYDDRIKNNLRILTNKITNFINDSQKELQSNEFNEALVSRYIQLKERVKEQDRIIDETQKLLKDITEKHNKREKFYAKWGFIN